MQFCTNTVAWSDPHYYYRYCEGDLHSFTGRHTFVLTFVADELLQSPSVSFGSSDKRQLKIGLLTVRLAEKQHFNFADISYVQTVHSCK